jgi:arylsulfatase A-like enzyme
MKTKPRRALTALAIIIFGCLALFMDPPSPPRRIPEDINVILLTVDSIRPDHLGCYGYRRRTSPTIDGLADGGRLFRRAFSQSSWTIPGIMSTLTSLQPPAHGVEERGDTLDPSVRTILDSFRDAGYVVPNISFLLTIPEFAGLGMGQPEEKYFSEKDDDEFLRWLDDNHESKFFAWYHYRGVHLPYNAREASKAIFLPFFPADHELSSGIRAVLSDAAVVPVGTAEFRENDRGLLYGMYDAEVKDLDSFVGRLLMKLRRHGLLEKTLIVITADHGEELLDHGFVGHSSTMHAATLYDEAIRIPLIFSLPGSLPAGPEINELVQQIDIMPTILDVAGIGAPAGMQGRSLLPLLLDLEEEREASIPVFAETVFGGYQATQEMALTRWRCIRTDSWKLIEVEEPGLTSYRLYDLQLDPRESRDVYDDEAAAASFMKELLAEMKNQNQIRKESMGARAVGDVVAGGITTCPEFIFPYDGAVLNFDERRGTLRASWTAEKGTPHVVEYDIGQGIHRLTGSFAVRGDKRVYGPYSGEMWKALAVRNPWRVRISPDVQPRCWSEWIEFSFE